MADLSIIIPCYNHGEYLAEALSSLHGSGLSMEIIVVDDGSKDPATLATLDSLERGGNIKVVRKENGGVGSARNLGISLSTSEFFIPLDADNMLNEDALAPALATMRADDTLAVVYGDAQFFGKHGGTWQNKSLVYEQILFSNQIDNCVMMRRKAWVDVGGYELDKTFQSHADWLMWLNLLDRGWGFHYQPGIFFHYRVLENSMLRTDGKAMSKVARISARAYPVQRSLVHRLARTGQMAGSTGKSVLAQIESQLAYYLLLYGNFLAGLGALLSSSSHSIKIWPKNLRIMVVCPTKRFIHSLFGVELSMKPR